MSLNNISYIIFGGGNVIAMALVGIGLAFPAWEQHGCGHDSTNWLNQDGFGSVYIIHASFVNL